VKERRALFPASFDPMTNGHMDIIGRVLRLGVFEEFVLAVGKNPEKKSLFSVEERVDLLREVVADLQNGHTLRVTVLDGLMVDFAREMGATAIIRGVRSPRDFEYEAEMGFLNHHLAPDIEMLFLIADPRYAFLSSTLVKQVAQMGGNLEGLVPTAVIDRLRSRVAGEASPQA
jgi:pantetheine-phosphate adenylyltransferase